MGSGSGRKETAPSGNWWVSVLNAARYASHGSLHPSVLRPSPYQDFATLLILPVELRAHLPDARSVRAGHYPEQAAAEVAVRAIELGVVDDVKEFTAELNSHGFGNRNPLRHPEIGVEEAGAMEEPGTGVAEMSEGVGCEGAWEEILVRAVRSGQTTGPTRFGSSVELLPVSDRSPRYWLI